jgi:hypothetical protein
MPAIADDDDDGDEGRGGAKKALRADCEHQANRQDLIGKERKKFVQACYKDGKHAKRRGENARPAATQPAQPAAQPATTAAPPPTSTAPAQPTATPTSPPPATTPAATPQPPKPVLTTEQKLQKCTEEAQRANTLGRARTQYIEKCMAR